MKLNIEMSLEFFFPNVAKHVFQFWVTLKVHLFILSEREHESQIFSLILFFSLNWILY